MEAARTSETLVNFYQTTRCYNPEDSNLHTHRRENLKSYSYLPSSQAALDSARPGKDSERPGAAVAVSKTLTVVDRPL
jgi:hypothetical protein